MPLDNIYQDINDRVQSDPNAAKIFFNLHGKPSNAWLKKIEQGVDAAQRIVNFEQAQREQDKQPGYVCDEPASDPEKPDPFDPDEADFGLGEKDDDPKPAPAPKIESADVESLLEKLRPLVRLNGSRDAQAVLGAVLNGAWSRKAMMLTPLALQIAPWVHFAHMAQLRTQPWLGYHQETDTLIQRARNRCAQAFLASEAEWSWWVDGDIVPSWGDPAFFYDMKRLGIPQNRISPDFLRKKTLERLMNHGRKIVGAVYQTRRRAGPLCTPADLRPNPTADEKEAVSMLRNRGPKDKLLEVDWCATGCLLVHRSVYEDIKAKRPDLAPQHPDAPWNFFGHDVARMGEDAAFGLLAKECGHQSYLDLGCWVAHLGNYAFMPEPIA